MKLQRNNEVNVEVTASLRYARISAQKCRLVADKIRGMPVSRALTTLVFFEKKGARLIKKLLESVIANAEHNHGLDIDELQVESICVDKASFYKRMQPRAKGRGNRILKPTSHIKIKVSILSESKQHGS